MGNNEDYSAWECERCNNTRPGECYLHNFLREMPDLNLRNEDVVDEIKVSFDLNCRDVKYLDV
jgi:glycosidase